MLHDYSLLGGISFFCGLFEVRHGVAPLLSELRELHPHTLTLRYKKIAAGGDNSYYSESGLFSSESSVSAPLFAMSM